MQTSEKQIEFACPGKIERQIQTSFSGESKEKIQNAERDPWISGMWLRELKAMQATSINIQAAQETLIDAMEEMQKEIQNLAQAWKWDEDPGNHSGKTPTHMNVNPPDQKRFQGDVQWTPAARNFPYPKKYE